MNKNVLMIMGGALAVAIIVAMIVQSKLGGSHEKATGVEILVANKKLLQGEKIKADDVRWQAWPEDALFTGVIRRSEQKDEKKLAVYDAPLRRIVEAGEPITEQVTITDAKGGSNYLAAAIAPGMRAVSVGVKAETAVSGFVGPGDFVDVILSYQPKMNGELQQYSGGIVQTFATETILSNVKVLAVDQDVKGDERDPKASAKTVTLEVSKTGAETLYLAQTMGSISLSLRHLGEKDTASDQKPSITTDMSRSAVIKRVEKIRNEEKTSSDTVRVYSGNSIQNVPVRAGQAPQQ
jgi:pilus assembly protein CpaB